MVGSVLVARMREERDFDHIEPVFFSTSQTGAKGPDIGGSRRPKSLFPARAAITPTKYFRSCALPAGKATGSTLPQRCA
jgi:aspartate-semialdehyde dehydrogenase